MNLVRERVTVSLDELDDLPEGPAVYVVWSAIGQMFGFAGLGNRPLYVGKTKRAVRDRMREHIRENDEAVPLIRSATRIEYFPCQNDRHARALEREIKEALNPFYDKE